MMDQHEHSAWEELLPLYALGALEGEERTAVEQHVGTCVPCRRELEQLERDLATLAEAPGPVVPPSAIRERLLSRIEVSKEDKPPQERSSARWWLVAAALLLLVTGGLWLQALETTRLLREERSRLALELARTESEISDLRRQQTALVREIETLRNPSSRHVLLAGLDEAPGASGRTVVSPAGDSARFYAFGLPELPEEQDYELWLIADGRPVPAGVFDVDARGEAALDVADLPPLETIEAWAVTVEPAGGVPQPTGSMVLKS